MRSLLIGINEYPEHRLYGCVDDVTGMEALLTKLGAPAPTKLLDADATAERITNAVKASVAALGANEKLLVYFAGHGVDFPTEGAGHQAYCPVDFDWTRPQTPILDQQLADMLEGLPSGSVCTVIADCCHSGGLSTDYIQLLDVAWSARFRPRTRPVPARMAAELARLQELDHMQTFDETFQKTDTVLLAACGAEQSCGEAPFEGGRVSGVLTHYMLEHFSDATTRAESASTTVDALRASIQPVYTSQTPELHGRMRLFGSPLL